MRTEVNYIERHAWEIIEQVIKQNISKKRASSILHCSTRTVERKMNLFKNEGMQGFMHKNCNRKSNKSIPQEIVDQILELRNTKYFDFSYIHFWEKLKSEENIYIAYKTLILILEKNLFISPFAHKVTKRKIRERMAKLGISDEKIPPIIIEQIIDNKYAHPLQPRKEFFGECVQTDASIHNWINKEKWALHAFIDESTGIVLGAYFDKEETLYGYYMATKQMFLEYGTPEEILTDRRRVFYSGKKDNGEVNSNTQYGFMCNQLNIILSCSSVAQNKGKIERLWQSFQRRLPQEFRLAGINTLDQANIYILDFIKQYNEKHALKIDEDKNSFRPWFVKKIDINFALSTHYTRKTLNGATIKFENKNYATYDKNGKRIMLSSKQEVMVIKTLTGNLLANCYEQFYTLIEIDKEEFLKENVAKKIKEIKDLEIKENSWRKMNWIFYKKKREDEESSYKKFSI